MHAPISFRDPARPRSRGILASASPAFDDCDDANHLIHPGAAESNNDAIDSDCDGFNDTNRLPSLFFTLTPSRVTTETTVTATSSASDPDGDPVTLAYDWFIDNRDGNGFIEVLGEDTASLGANFFDRDDIVKLTITASDGRGSAPPESKQVTVRNSVPVLSACNITPTVGGIATDFTATPVGLFDADTEDAGLLSSRYRWELRIGPVWDPFTGETAQTLASCTDREEPGNYQNCRRGNSIRAVCIPTDTIEDGIPYPSATITLVNLAPVVDQCAITPGAASTDTDLAVLAASSDPDADATVLLYQWVKNGVDVPGATGTSLPSSEFEHFDVINVRCTAYDGSIYGTAATSSPIVIGNTAPGAPTVDLTPNLPKSNQALSVSVTAAATDLDGDSVTYSYYWTRSGSQYLNPTYPSSVTTVAASATTRNETWEVTVVANDGFVDGGSDSDAVLILNTEPSVTSATLLPNNPTTAQDITAYGVGFDDDDGDPEGYVVRWYVNGVLQVPQTPDPMVIDDAFTVRGDQIYAELVAKDPFSTGNTVTSQTLTVVNTVPTPPVVAITPNPPGEQDNLTCGIITPSTDADGDTITYTYGWTRNGAVLAGETSATLSASATSFADIFTCTVTPNDGFVNGDTGVAPTIAIQDLNAPAAPTVSSIDRYRNETSATISGTCVSGALDCNTVQITCNDGIAADVYNASCTSDTFSQVVSTDRGLTTSCSAVCIDNSTNSSLASNTVTTESCNPYDSYENAGTYGDVGTDPIAEWAALADNNSASITIIGNIIGSDSRDWYKILTTDNAVADAAAGANAYKFELEMPVGSADYKFWMHNGSATATAECVGTGPHFGYIRDVEARNDAPNHVLAANPNACTSNGSATWSLYNECESFAMDYYVEVLRPLNTNCQHYQLRAYNGRP
jgi:hypothetical protein